jgi:hypothetical protein
MEVIGSMKLKTTTTKTTLVKIILDASTNLLMHFVFCHILFDIAHLD